MAATLDDLRDQVKKQTDSTEKLHRSFSSWFEAQKAARLDDLESAREEKNRNRSATAAGGSVASTVTVKGDGESFSKGFLGGLSGAMTAMAGGFGRTFGSLAGIGAGIAGFMGALALGGAAMDWIKVDYSGLGRAFASFSEAITELSPAAVTVLGTVLAASMGYAMFRGSPTRLAATMTGVGAGISGFMVGLKAGDALLSWTGTSYDNLGKAFKSFSDAISNLSVLAVSALGGVAMIATANNVFKGNPLNLALSMTAVAAGIAGFLGGLVLTDAGLTWLTNITGADGSGLASAMSMFADSIKALGITGAISFGALIGLAAFSKFSGGSPFDIAKGMTAIAMGIAAFTGGLVLADLGISWIGAIPSGSSDGLVSAFTMFGDAIGALGAGGAIMFGAIVGLSAFSNILKTGPAQILKGMGAFAVGIAGFMAALSLADVGITWINSAKQIDSGGLVSAFQMFNDSVGALGRDAMIALGAIVGVSAFTGVSTKKNLVAGMTAFGVGIGTFFTALSLADVGIGWLQTATGIDSGGLVGAFQMFNDSVGALGETAMIALGGIVAVSTFAGTAAATNIVAGMTAFSVGIGTFFAALKLADVGISWIDDAKNVSSEGLKGAFKMFDESVGSLGAPAMTALGVLLGLSAFTGLGTAVNVVAGMTAFGAGIGAFFVGLKLADVGISWLDNVKAAEDAGGATGLAGAFKMFNESVGSLDTKSLAAITGILGASAIAGLGLAANVVAGMTAFGGGIAAFFGALALGDWFVSVVGIAAGGEPGEAIGTLLSNVFTNLSPIMDLDATQMLAIGPALVAVAAGLAAITATDLISSISGAISGLFNFFSGEKSPTKQALELAKNADDLDIAAKSIQSLATSLTRIGNLNFDGSKINFRAFAQDLYDSVPLIESAIGGGSIDGGWWGSDVDFRGLASKEIDFDQAAENIDMLMSALNPQPTVFQITPNMQGFGQTGLGANPIIDTGNQTVVVPQIEAINMSQIGQMDWNGAGY